MLLMLSTILSGTINCNCVIVQNVKAADIYHILSGMKCIRHVNAAYTSNVLQLPLNATLLQQQ